MKMFFVSHGKGLMLMKKLSFKHVVLVEDRFISHDFLLSYLRTYHHLFQVQNQVFCHLHHHPPYLLRNTPQLLHQNLVKNHQMYQVECLHQLHLIIHLMFHQIVHPTSLAQCRHLSQAVFHHQSLHWFHQINHLHILH